MTNDTQRILLAIEKNGEGIKENREIIDYLKDNMISREELHTELDALRKDLHEELLSKKEFFRAMTIFRDEIITHIDGIATQYRACDMEIVALRSKTSRLESHVDQIAKHIDIDLK